MALPNPIYIGQNAIHQPPAIRMLSYATTTGVSGVLGTTDGKVQALAAPAGAIQALPCGYMVKSKALASAYEGYAGKWDVAETVAVSNVSSAGPRRDLVVLVIKDPYVSGAGAWTPPGDLVYGPYAEIRIIENVSTTQWDVSQTVEGAAWSAITLAKIDRPANSTIVTNAQITDCRSLAALGGTRTVVEQVSLPPIAQSYYLEFKESTKDPNYGNPSGGTDTAHDYLDADTLTKNWPAVATWSVPVPSWAVTCDAEFQVYNVMLLTGDAYGKLWLDFGGTATTFQTYAVAWTGTPGRYTVPYGKTFTVPLALRGTVITVRTKFASYWVAPGRLDAKSGVVTRLALNFQRVPD